LIDKSGVKENIEKIYWKNKISWGELRRAQDQKYTEEIFLDIAYYGLSELKNINL
jgi:hypothetical protein